MAGFWSQNYHKYERLSLPVVVAVAAVGLTVGVLIPQTNGAIAANQEIKALRQSLANLTAKAQFLEELDLNQLQQQSFLLTQALPSDSDIGSFLAGLKAAATRAGAGIVEIELLAEQGEATATNTSGTARVARKRVPKKQAEASALMRVGIQGDVASLKQFLSEISRSLPLAQVVEIAGGAASSGVLASQVTLKYYWVALPQTLGLAETAVEPVTGAEEQIYNQLVDFGRPETAELPQVETGNKNLLR